MAKCLRDGPSSAAAAADKDADEDVNADVDADAGPGADTNNTSVDVDGGGDADTEPDVRRLLRAERSQSSNGFGRVDGGSGEDTLSGPSGPQGEAIAAVVRDGIAGWSIWSIRLSASFSISGCAGQSVVG